MTYTRAQIAAFAWLPADGSWVHPLDSSKPIVSLAKWHADLVQVRRMARGCSRARVVTEYRLTPAGVAERKRLVKERLIE